jgi:solute:Na+ symporter, SSS family
MNSVSTLTVRDFILHFRPRTTERMQVLLGRIVIVVAALLGVLAAYAVYKTPDGLYKYLQTVSIYLTIPVAPAIIFGILSKRATAKGALASVVVGCALASLFVTDQLIGPQAGSRWFPWLHTSFTLNYTYRGLWGSAVIVVTLFAVSAVTSRTDPAILERLTVTCKNKPERFQGFLDWRLHLVGLSAITILLYWFLW